MTLNSAASLATHITKDSNDSPTDTNNTTTIMDADDLDSGSRKRSMSPSDPSLNQQRSKEARISPPASQSSSKSSSSGPPSPSNQYTPDPPEWDKHPKAWGYLQALVPMYPSGYLDRQTYKDQGRTGYMLGRAPGSDFHCERPEISKQHCCIYMVQYHQESANDGRDKGVFVYLEDRSSNGTYVNGEIVGRASRKVLRSGDRIQLYRKTRFAEDDPRHLFYRILLPPQFEVGTFHEDYRSGDMVGRGHFATVLKALHKETDREVAVKLISKSRFQSKPKMLSSTIQEIGVLMALEAHPCVIQIEKVYNEPKYIYLVLEYVRDGELFDHVVANSHLSERDTRFVFLQLFLAIRFLHQQGVVHRDLKPENVLLVNKKKLHLKITDFGLAKLKPKDDPLSSQCGTPNYVAPEVLKRNDRAYGKECDLWSLGVMLYICLCGFPPFNEEYAPPTMKEQILNAQYTFPTPYWDGISSEAKQLIEGLLCKEPTERLTVEQALDHPWMKMEPEELEDMCNAVSYDFRSKLETHGVLDEGLLPTQPVINSLTQSFDPHDAYDRSQEL